MGQRANPNGVQGAEPESFPSVQRPSGTSSTSAEAQLEEHRRIDSPKLSYLKSWVHTSVSVAPSPSMSRKINLIGPI